MKLLSNKSYVSKLEFELMEVTPIRKSWNKSPATPLLSKIGYVILAYMLYTYYELDGWYGFTNIEFSDIITFILVWFFSYMWSRAVLFASRPRMCECGSIDFVMEDLGKEYIDTTPTTKSGARDFRYTPTGFSIRHFRFTCKKCGGYHMDTK